ncbi:phage holin family protein [Cupriavidus sp. 30B13]|uniref:phage holin family protein n=1 Tax=Cupriavidus sp. 30B13 TaxID=3384241 RepID=UPI003B8FDC0F
MRLLAVWIINAAALFLVGNLISGIHLGGFGSAMIAALVLGLVNTLIRPVLVILTLPVTLLTLGLFIFVINALLFLFVGKLLSGFVVSGFGAALLGSILYSVISWLLSSVLLGERRNA